MSSPRLYQLRNTVACGISLAVVATLSACAVGPDYRTPQLPQIDEWHTPPAPDAQAPASNDATLAAWWTVLNDPTLDQFLESAVKENKSVEQAIARVREARARRGISSAGLFPTLDVSASGRNTERRSNGNCVMLPGNLTANRS